jgi:hypothetical protein
MDKPVKRQPKKPYSPPSLTVYGTVRELTKQVGPARSSDGGRFPRNHTSLN